MSERIIEEDGAENGTAQRLVDSGIALIAAGGLRALTIRDVAARAGIAFPSVQYHFPTKALLVDEIFAAVERRHCQETERLLVGLALQDGGERALGSIVLAVLWEWCARRTAMTIAVHEMLLAAYRGSIHAEFGRNWVARQHAILTGLVGRVTGRTDGALAWFILEMLIGLSLMSLGCDNPVDVGLANDEILRYAFLSPAEQRAFDPAWHRLFTDRADREGDPAETEPAGAALATTHPAARKILDASIRIVANEGSGALTFRGVATEAGVAISSITNNFHTRATLIYRVYRRIQDAMAEIGLSQRPSVPAPEERPSQADRTLRLLQSVSAGKFPLFVAAYDLVLAAARDEGLGRQAWRIRITRGIYLLIRRGHLPAPPPLAQFRSHVHSLWTIGVGLLHGIAQDPAPEREAALARRLRFGFSRLGE